MSHGTKALFVLLALYGLVPILFLTFAEMSVDRQPELTPSQASKILESTADFRSRGSYPRVSLVHKRVEPSEVGRSATFSFMSKKDGLRVKEATAEFFFFNRQWRLAAFWWGEPPTAESYVRIGGNRDIP